MLLFLLLLAAPAAAQNALPGGPAFHDQSYKVFLKQGGEGLADEDHHHLLSSGNPLPLTHSLSPLHAFNTLKDIPTAAYDVVLRLIEAGQDETVRTQWLGALLGSLCVVACGILPALFMPDHVGAGFHDPDSTAHRNLNRALAFSVGSLLGDVFLHLLPESYATFSDQANVGLFIIAGIIFCLLLEKLLSSTEEDRRRVAAILNLLANVVDNASHGLAIGGSFLVSTKFGCLTTIAILLHEIPHEVSDFAILLRGDFSRWSAFKAQMVTSSGSLLGAGVALTCGVGAGADWILPFTAGGFLNIALVQLLPDILQERNRQEGVIQLVLILLGVGVMQCMNSFLLFV